MSRDAYPLKQAVKQVAGRLGFEIRRKQADAGTSRMSARGAFGNARAAGLAPRTIIDVGVANGTPDLYEAFPTAQLLMVEPLMEYTTDLERIAAGRQGAQYVIAAASDVEGQLTLNVHPDLVGSSLYREQEESDVNGVPRTVKTVRLDALCRERELRGPYVIKVDVQGAELDVLAGAEGILDETQLISLEVSLFQFFEQGPQLYQTVSYMKQRGFVAYDVYDPQYRPLDGAMSQIDIAFVREDGMLRKHHYYATREQRALRDAALRHGIG